MGVHARNPRARYGFSVEHEHATIVTFWQRVALSGICGALGATSLVSERFRSPHFADRFPSGKKSSEWFSRRRGLVRGPSRYTGAPREAVLPDVAGGLLRKCRAIWATMRIGVGRQATKVSGWLGSACPWIMLSFRLERRVREIAMTITRFRLHARASTRCAAAQLRVSLGERAAGSPHAVLCAAGPITTAAGLRGRAW